MNLKSDFIAVRDALEALKAGRMLLVTDDAGREDEGDLIVATESLTLEHLNFMTKHGRGLICVSVAAEVARRLDLPFQVENNNSRFHTPFTATIDYIGAEFGTGVTLSNRLLTIKKIHCPELGPESFRSPGHVFPLVAHPAGVLGRAGHTEAASDLARMAGFLASGVLCEVLGEDGEVLRGERLKSFAQHHTIPIVSIEQISSYRIEFENTVRQLASADTEIGGAQAKVFVFGDDVQNKEHLAIVFGEPKGAPLVRVHSECLTGDIFGSRRCDCGLQLSGALSKILQEGSGVVLYLRQEGRGIGLGKKIEAYALQDQGLDTVEANIHLGFEPDLRDFRVASNILKVLGLSRIRLLTNNPRKVKTITESGVEVVERIALIAPEDPVTRKYLEAKREKLGHLL